MVTAPAAAAPAALALAMATLPRSIPLRPQLNLTPCSHPSCAQVFDELKPQELANLVWALAKATHHAPPLFERAAARAVAWLEEDAPQRHADEWDELEVVAVPGFMTLELTNLLYSFGKAGHAAPALFAAAAAQVVSGGLAGGRSLVGWSAQDVCNTMWACASLDARHDHLLAACQDALASRAYELDRTHLTQIQQWLIWWEAELGYAVDMPPELRERCRTSLASGDTVHGHTVSALQASVERALSRLRLTYTRELTTVEGYSVDIVVPSHGLAIEVDGPHHYTQMSTPTGATKLKRRQLRATGWAVAAIPFFAWYRLNGNPNEECAYLQQLVATAWPATAPRGMLGRPT
jgi:hypothetical protein